MPWKSEIAAELDAAQQTIVQLQGELTDLKGQLETVQVVGRVALEVEQELETPASLAAMDEDAQAMAKVSVIGSERERLTAKLAAGLQEDKYDEIAAEFRLDEGPRIRSDLDELFKIDGTYDGIRCRVQADVKAEVQAELLAEAEQAEKDRLSSPEAAAQLRQSLKTELAGSDEMAELKKKLRLERLEALNEEIRDEVKADIQASETLAEADFKAAQKVDLLKTNFVEKQQKAVRSKLEEQWGKATHEEVAAQIHDKELDELLTKKATLIKQQLESELATTELLAAFTGHGVDSSTIPEGSRLVLFLGHTRMCDVTEQYRDEYGRNGNRKVKKQGLDCERKLSIVSLGKGRFVVDDDSLLESRSGYVRDNAVPRGKVILVGRRIIDGDHESLEQRLVMDVPLCLDDDTNDPHITDAVYPLANIKIDGKYARDLAFVNMTEGGKTN